MFTKIRLLVAIFFTPCLTLFSIHPTAELLHYYEMAKKDVFLDGYLEQFPYTDYQVFNVPKLGSFFIDNLPDSIKSHLRSGIYWEEGISTFVKRYTQPKTIAIDLGAHIGIHTIAMSRIVGADGLVIAFEPQFKIYRELVNNLRINNCLDNVILLPFAAGEKEQMVEMTVADPNNEGGTPIGKGGNKALMITIDSLNLKNVSFIKMDVESYELNVLIGAKETLRKNMPVIVFEILGGYDLDHCSGNEKEQYMATLKFLKSLGYHIERIYGNDFVALPNKRTVQ